MHDTFMKGVFEGGTWFVILSAYTLLQRVHYGTKILFIGREIKYSGECAYVFWEGPGPGPDCVCGCCGKEKDD